jgi:hypothetical protein
MPFLMPAIMPGTTGIFKMPPVTVLLAYDYLQPGL